jgi:hypothetical protein
MEVRRSGRALEFVRVFFGLGPLLVQTIMERNILLVALGATNQQY